MKNGAMPDISGLVIVATSLIPTMFGTQHLALFVASGLLLNITPGQDTLYIVGRTISQGRRAGVLSVLGISSGAMIHTLAATSGLAAILAASAQAFLVVRIAGAVYLAYLGIRMLATRHAEDSGALIFGRDT